MRGAACGAGRIFCTLVTKMALHHTPVTHTGVPRAAHTDCAGCGRRLANRGAQWRKRKAGKPSSWDGRPTKSALFSQTHT